MKSSKERYLLGQNTTCFVLKHVVLCPNKQRSFKPFMCLDLKYAVCERVYIAWPLLCLKHFLGDRIFVVYTQQKPC